MLAGQAARSPRRGRLSVALRAEEVLARLQTAYGRPRNTDRRPPLDELVSTILSQNTNDTNRDRAFKKLRQTFPTWEQVRDAPSADVIEAIRTAGLANQKGPRIQKALRRISDERGALELDFLNDLPLPEARAWLQHGCRSKPAA